MPDQQQDEVTAWARDVVRRRVPACRYVRLAARRHLDDLKQGRKRGLLWQPRAAQHRIGFYPRFLRHSKGEWARQPVELSGWQKFVIGSVFGWKRADGTRRFRYVYEEVPRKNGKSTLLAGVGLDMLLCDGELGAEIYAAATKRDQARIIFDEAKRMVSASPELQRYVSRFKLNLSVDRTGSKFEPLSSDERTLDGLNPHCVLIDELHRHRTRALLDVHGHRGRRPPAAADLDHHHRGRRRTSSQCTRQRTTTRSRCSKARMHDDNVFAFISTIDKDDRWDDPKAWAKANPNLGMSREARRSGAPGSARQRSHRARWSPSSGCG